MDVSVCDPLMRPIVAQYLMKDAGDLYSADPNSLSSFQLYRSRIAQFIDEVSLEQQTCDALLSEEARGKLIEFVQKFQEKYSERETKRMNRFFDELACNRRLYEYMMILKEKQRGSFNELVKNESPLLMEIREDLVS